MEILQTMNPRSRISSCGFSSRSARKIESPIERISKRPKPFLKYVFHGAFGRFSLATSKAATTTTTIITATTAIGIISNCPPCTAGEPGGSVGVIADVELETAGEVCCGGVCVSVGKAESLTEGDWLLPPEGEGLLLALVG